MYSITVVIYSEYAAKFSMSSAEGGILRCSFIYLRNSSTESNVNTDDSFPESVGFSTNALMLISMPSKVSLKIWFNLPTQPAISDVDIPTAPRYKISSVPMANSDIFLPLMNGSGFMMYPAIEKISRISGQSCFAGALGVVGMNVCAGIFVWVGAGAKVFAGAMFSRGGRGGSGVVCVGATGVGVC